MLFNKSFHFWDVLVWSSLSASLPFCGGLTGAPRGACTPAALECERQGRPGVLLPGGTSWGRMHPKGKQLHSGRQTRPQEQASGDRVEGVFVTLSCLIPNPANWNPASLVRAVSVSRLHMSTEPGRAVSSATCIQDRKEWWPPSFWLHDKVRGKGRERGLAPHFNTDMSQKAAPLSSPQNTRQLCLGLTGMGRSRAWGVQCVSVAKLSYAVTQADAGRSAAVKVSWRCD